MNANLRQWASLSIFDPEKGLTVMKADKPDTDYWVGAPSVVFDGQRFVMAYRVRYPMDKGRGIACRIAESVDGRSFEVTGEIKKESFNTSSIERSALQVMPDGEWRLYVSYVDPADRRWRIDLLRADSPSQFTATNRTVALTADMFNVEGIKDPFVFMVGPVTYMMMNYVDLPDYPISADEMHGTENAFATGRMRSKTGLAYSLDGVHFTWQGMAIEPGTSWDYLLARGSTIIPQDGVYWMWFDGRATIKETYQDRAGLAVSHDLRHWIKLDTDEPRLQSAHGTGSLRYIDALTLDGRVYYYYEYALDDGSHEIRLSIV